MPTKIILWETAHWSVLLGEHQTYLGYAVAVAKHPRASLSELTSEEWLDLATKVIQPYEAAVKKAFGAELCNWSCLMNNAYQNTPPDPQVHWHAKPRYRHSVEIMGEVFTDETFGHHYILEPLRLVSTELREEIAKRLRAALVIA